jgi:hypothetical protein
MICQLGSKAAKAALTMVLCGLLSCPAWAQYHLNEMGVRLGGGSNLPLGQNGLSPSYAYGAHAYFTHYRCGKRDGFWAEVGLRGCNLQERPTDTPNLFSPEGGPDLDLHLLYFDAGLFYKFRKHNYHNARETAFLLGPRLNLRVLGRAQFGDRNDSFYRNDYRQVAIALPGIHLGVILRRPLGKKGKSLFLYPGLDYYIGNAASAEGLTLQHFYPSLNLAFIFWKNK